MGTLQLSFAFVYLGKCCMVLSVKALHECLRQFSNRFCSPLGLDVGSSRACFPTCHSAPQAQALHQYATCTSCADSSRSRRSKAKPHHPVHVQGSVLHRHSRQKSSLAHVCVPAQVMWGCVSFFDGTLCEEPKLEGTKHAERHRCALNFDDMVMAAASLFFNLLSGATTQPRWVRPNRV